MYRIQILNNIAQVGLDRLPSSRYLTGKDVEHPQAILLRSADLHQFEIPGSVLAIGRAGAGTNNIPVADMSRRGIPVFNAPGANANAVKELVLAGLLMASRNLAPALAFVAALDADRPDLEKAVEEGKKRFVGAELPGKTLGVIGLGAIGVLVANGAQGLGMRVLGHDPHMTVEGAWRLSADVQRADTLHALYGQADFVTVHVPLNDATRGMISRSALAAMKPGAVMLNFSREAIVDEDALIEALQAGRLGAYVSDFPSARLIGNPRVLALPHLGASTAEAEENCAVMVADQVRNYLEHGEILNSVNFPNLRLVRDGVARVCVVNANRPNMIGQISQVLGTANLNIVQMHNASRGELAYNVLDLEAPVPDAAREALAAIDGILAVRVI